MTGLDANVLVRYITRDDPEQYRAAKSFLESNCTREEPGYVNVSVLCELAWVLTSVYDTTEEELAGVLDQLLRTRQLQIERRRIIALPSLDDSMIHRFTRTHRRSDRVPDQRIRPSSLPHLLSDFPTVPDLGLVPHRTCP